jgi:putative PIN family toxin of toxin-antitoxin system
MVDANIIISASLFPNSIVGNVFSHVVNNHEIVLCEYTIDELKTVFERKFNDRVRYLNQFIKDLKYELVRYEIKANEIFPKIRDNKDIPLLVSAIESKVNLLLTGDKDFEEIEMENLKIMNPRKYIDEYFGKSK